MFSLEITVILHGNEPPYPVYRVPLTKTLLQDFHISFITMHRYCMRYSNSQYNSTIHSLIWKERKKLNSVSCGLMDFFFLEGLLCKTVDMD